ncbi:MAG: hypothetical protein ACTSO7_18635 [Candidatus Heimdallarchaeota archaeon]
MVLFGFWILISLYLFEAICYLIIGGRFLQYAFVNNIITTAVIRKAAPSVSTHEADTNDTNLLEETSLHETNEVQ